jgi:hypothetical protein
MVKRQKTSNSQTAAQTGTVCIVIWDFFGVWKFGVSLPVISKT